MKDKFRKRRYNPKAIMPINIWGGKRRRRTLKKYFKYISYNTQLPLIGEELFSNENIKSFRTTFIKTH